MERDINIVVPINDMGVYGMTENIAAYDERNFKIFALTDAERYSISALFFQFNDEFDILIDDFEEDILMVKQLPRAIQITREFIDNVDDDLARASAKKVIDALIFAQTSGMPAEFCF